MTHNVSARVKVLAVRPRRNPQTGAMLNTLIDEWVDALALHCDIEEIDEDFDLIEVYERVRPDLLVFDSVQWARRHRVNITNIDAYPDLPRTLLYNCDPHDPMRPLVMEMLAAYRIDAVFCAGTEGVEQMHELRRINCFMTPRFFDARSFHPYGEAQSIPVTIMSAHLFPSFYAWRAQVTAEIQHIMPTMLYTHPGYGEGLDPFEIRDEGFARMLSRSKFCVADTTRLDYVVRKHLEIPATGSVLISSPSEALPYYGFVDMENCIIGDAGPALYAKIIEVARDPVLYEKIRTAGQELVHRRFTREAWTFILDWFACHRDLKPGERVQQDGVFGPFRAVPDGAGVKPVAGYAIHDNPMSAKLRGAREALLGNGDLQAALADMDAVGRWIGHIAEPWFLSGVIALAAGDLGAAASFLARRSALQGSEDPSLGVLDPCEIAWLLLIAYLSEQTDLFGQMSDCAAATSHVSLRRVQWLIDGAKPVEDLAAAGLDAPRPGDCPSIHWLGDEDFASWLGLVGRILAANGLPRMAFAA